MAFKATILPHRSVIEVSGAPARDFLQGLATVDVGDVAKGAARHGALLTPQGKILYDFGIRHDGEDTLLLDTARDFAADLAKRLVFYRLRAKVEIVVRDDLAVVAIWGGDGAPDVPGATPDPRLAALGWRAVLPAGETEGILQAAKIELVEADAYDERRIALGVAEAARDYASGEIFPHEADLDQLAGVDFDKGCFVGQEVVSRMQHRGTARKRFVPVEIDGAAPPAGAEIRAGDAALGVMGSAAGGRGLALIRLDRLADALKQGAAIRAGEARLTPHRPDWAHFEWPGGTA